MGFLKNLFGGDKPENQKPNGSREPGTAEEFSARGAQLMDEDQYGKAVDCYTKAIQLDPNRASYYFARSSCLLSLNQLESATEDATRAIALAPDHYLNYFQRGLCLHRMGNPGNAVVDLFRAVELNPEDPIMAAEVLTRRGRILRDLQCHDRALTDFIDAAQQNPARKAALSWDIAASWDALECPAQALEAFKMFLSLNPSPPPQVVNRLKERIPQLAFLVEKGLVSEPDEHFGKAQELTAEQEYGNAVAELSRAVIKGDDPLFNYGCYLQRGEIFYHKEADVLALADFSAAIEIDPGRPEAFADRGDVYYHMGEMDLAEADYRTALGLQERDVEMLDLSTGETTICEISPGAASVYDSLGILYANTGRASQAIDAFAAALKIEPGNEDYQEHLRIAKKKAAAKST